MASKKPDFCVTLHPEFIQRTISTHHSSEFARLEIELFYMPSQF